MPKKQEPKKNSFWDEWEEEVDNNAQAYKRREKRKGITDDEIDELVNSAVRQAVQDNEPAGWTTTFGDLMSLLLVFFVMLFAMSEIEIQKFMDVAQSLKQGFGVAESDSTGAQQDDPESSGLFERDEVDDFLAYIEEKLDSFVAEHELANTIEVTKDRTGVTLKIQDLILFDVASAELKPETRWIAEKLSKIVTEIAVPVIVSGHTDSTPITTSKFPSNWELSGARASTLTRLFIANGFDPHGIHIEGYAEFKPEEANDTPEGRAKNRRVELQYTRQNVFAKILEGDAKLPTRNRKRNL